MVSKDLKNIFLIRDKIGLRFLEHLFLHMEAFFILYIF